VFNPSFIASGEGEVTAPSSSFTYAGGDVSTTYTAPTTTTTVTPPAGGGGATVQAANGLRSALQPGNLRNSMASAGSAVANVLRG
jgi:hypothetical protein